MPDPRRTPLIPGDTPRSRVLSEIVSLRNRDLPGVARPTEEDRLSRIRIPVPLRWGDLDAYGHVNNATMLRLLEEARIRAFWHSDDPAEPSPATAIVPADPGAGTITLIARQEIEYLAPVPYSRRPLEVELWIGRLGGASLDACYEVRLPAEGEAGGAVVARATTTIVLVDAATQRPRRITDAERAAWDPFVEQPIAFTRRG